MGQVAIRVDDELKEEASALFQKLGFDMSTACRMFFKKCVVTQSIPFDLSVNPGDYDERGIYITDERLSEASNFLSDYAAKYARKGTLEELFDEEW